jgi:hypothetical protein
MHGRTSGKGNRGSRVEVDETARRSTVPGSAVGPDVSAADASALVDTAAAAKLLGVEPKTLANWRSAGRGPAYITYDRRRGPVRYEVKHLLAWREEHTRGTVSGDRDA